MTAGRADVAAVFAELASSDPRYCPSRTGGLPTWAAMIERPATGSVALVPPPFFGPGFLEPAQRQRAGINQLLDIETAVEGGATVPLREVELASRLVTSPIDQGQFPELMRLLGRQVAFVGSLPDGLIPSDWDRVYSAGVDDRLGIAHAQVSGNMSFGPAPMGDEHGPGLLAHIALTPHDEPGFAPSSDPSYAATVDVRGLLAAVTLRTGDCTYLTPIAARLADASGLEDEPDGRALVGQSLEARAFGMCAVATGYPDSAVARMRSRVEASLDASLASIRVSPLGPEAGRAFADQILLHWGLVEGGCVLDRLLDSQSREVATKRASAYLDAIVGDAAFTVYSSDALYAALRLRELGEHGCDGRGWWYGR